MGDALCKLFFSFSSAFVLCDLFFLCIFFIFHFLQFSRSYQTHCIYTLYSISVMTKCIRYEVTILVMALWLYSRAFNFTSIQRVSICMCVCILYRACGHHTRRIWLLKINWRSEWLYYLLCYCCCCCRLSKLLCRCTTGFQSNVNVTDTMHNLRVLILSVFLSEYTQIHPYKHQFSFAYVYPSSISLVQGTEEEEKNEHIHTYLWIWMNRLPVFFSCIPFSHLISFI